MRILLHFDSCHRGVHQVLVGGSRYVPIRSVRTFLFLFLLDLNFIICHAELCSFEISVFSVQLRFTERVYEPILCTRGIEILFWLWIPTYGVDGVGWLGFAGWLAEWIHGAHVSYCPPAHPPATHNPSIVINHVVRQFAYGPSPISSRSSIPN